MSLEADPVEQSGSSPMVPAEPGDEGPPRGPLLLACLVLVAVPTMVLLCACACAAFWLIVAGSGEPTSPMNLLAAIVFPVPLLLILLFEYQAVIKRSGVAALLVGALFLFPLFPGTAALADELSGLLGQEQPNPDVWNWMPIATIAGCVTVTTWISIVHFAWWRRLVSWRSGQV